MELRVPLTGSEASLAPKILIPFGPRPKSAYRYTVCPTKEGRFNVPKLQGLRPKNDSEPSLPACPPSSSN